MENCPPVKQIKLLEDDVYTRGVISSFIEDIEKHHGKQPVILRCVHQLVKDIPGSSLGKQVTSICLFVWLSIQVQWCVTAVRRKVFLSPSSLTVFSHLWPAGKIELANISIFDWLSIH